MQGVLQPVFCLIVEDSPLVGLDLAEALEASGYFVAGPFPCGREASDWLARFTPDVAVVDLTLRDGRCMILSVSFRPVPFPSSSTQAARSSTGCLTFRPLCPGWRSLHPP